MSLSSGFEAVPFREVKIVLASVMMALAAYQVAPIVVGYGKLRLPFLKPAAASAAHRALGDGIVVIALVVTMLCLARFEIEDDSAPHILAASALLAVLAVKIAVVRRWLDADRLLPWLGGAVFVLFAAAWATSAAPRLF